MDAPSHAVTMEASGHSINTDIAYTGSGIFFAFPPTLEVSGSWQEIEPKKNGQHLGLEKPTTNQRKPEGIKRFAHHHHLQKSSSIYSSRDMATSFTSDKPILPHIKQQYICCRKRNEPLPLSMIRGEVVHTNHMARQTSKHPEQEQSREAPSNGSITTNAPTITEFGDPISTAITEPSSTRDGLYIDAQVNINYCNFPEFDEFPNLDKYRLYAPIEMEGSAPMVTEIIEPSSSRNGLFIDTQLEDINDCSIPEFEDFPDFEEQRPAPIVMEGSAPAMTEIADPSSGRNGLCIDTQVEISNSCHLSEFKEFSDFFDEHGLSAPTMTEITESSSPRDGLHIYTQMEENNDCDLLEFEQFPGFDAPSVMEGGDPCMSKTTESSSTRDGLNTDTQLENIKDCSIPETEFQGFYEFGLSVYEPGDEDDIMLVN
ncbi:hypothetical protein COCNU_scaffold003742G000010 [Cocos nucifera]|nr:hypothetical protein [Cocos nucifera]